MRGSHRRTFFLKRVERGIGEEGRDGRRSRREKEEREGGRVRPQRSEKGS